MKKVTYFLGQGMGKLAVSDLQKALLFLGFQIDERETSHAFFGFSTREAVNAFQRHYHLSETGIVDEVTAQRINALLEARGVLDDDQEEMDLAQTVIAAPPLPPASLSPAPSFAAGPVPPTDGPVLPRPPAGQGPVPQPPTKPAPPVVPAPAPVPAPPTGTVPPVTPAPTPAPVPGPVTPLPLPQPAGQYRIKGVVQDVNGQGVANVTVRVLNKLLRDEIVLNETTTQADGLYTLTYTPPSGGAITPHLPGVDDRPDLGIALPGREPVSGFTIVVRALRDGKSWLQSDPVFNPGPAVLVNLLEGGGTYRGPAAYDQTINILRPQIGDLALTSLVENDQVHDITYLAAATGQGTQEIMKVVIASHLQQKTSIASEAFYALFQAHLPKNLPDDLLERTFDFTMLDPLLNRLLDGITALNEEIIRTTLTQALADNVLPVRFKSQIESIVQNFAALDAQRVLEQPAYGGKTSLKDLLALSSLKQEQYPLLANLYLANNGATKRFWESLKGQSQISPQQVADLRLTLDLGVKIKNHVPLLRTLKTRFAQEQYSQIPDLARLSLDQWGELIQASTTATEKGYPSNIDGNTEDEKIATYAAILSERFAQAYPTTALAARVDRSDVPGLENKGGALQFFNNNPALNLRRANLDAYLKNNKDALKGIIHPELALKDVRVMQRALQLAPDVRVAHALLTHNLHSAYQIYTMGRSRFVRTLATGNKPVHALNAAPMMGDDQHVTTTEANQVYAAAEMKYATVTAQLLNFNMAYNRLTPGAFLAPVTPEVLSSKQVEQDYPNLKSLFGSLDSCDCAHCQSVYGPAAYLTDLLLFLRQRNAQAGTVKDVLFQRRPDIGDIDLNCDNTEVPLPYIDLVNEVLEDAVEPPVVYHLPASIAPDLVDGPIRPGVQTALQGQGLALSSETMVSVITAGVLWGLKESTGSYKLRKTATGFDVRLSRQTGGSADELRAHPEYINAAVYNGKLKNACFPLTLPLDLWWEEARLYLRQLGIERYRLMETFQQRAATPASPADESIAAEFFGINDAERLLICTAAPAQQAARWGVSNPVTDLATVSVFLKQSGFDQIAGREYATLLELLAARFVNPSTNMSVPQENAGGSGCNVENQTISNLTPQKLDVMYRFIRLWRRTGWQIWELDLLLRAPAIGNNTLDGNALIQLRRFAELQQQLQLPVETLLAFYQPLNIETREIGAQEELPLYTQLFQNKAVINPLNPNFSISAVTSSSPTRQLSDEIATLQAALSLTAEDLGLLIPHTDGTLTLQNISYLYRYASLARVLKLSVDDLLRFLQLSTIADPFASVQQTQALLASYATLERARFTIEEISYVLTFDASSPLGLSDETMTQYMTTLRTNLQKTSDALSTGATTPLENIRKTLAGFPQFKTPERLQTALTIIDGSWSGSGADRDSFIASYFADFTDVNEAQARLGPLSGGDPAQQEAEINARCAYILDALYRTLGQQTIVETLSTLFGMGQKQIKAALETLSRGGKPLLSYFQDAELLTKNANGDYEKSLNDPAFSELAACMCLLHKIATLITKFQVSDDDFAWLLGETHSYGNLVDGTLVPGFDFAHIPVASGEPALNFHTWRNLAQLLDWQGRYPRQEQLSFLSILAGLGTQSLSFDQLATWTGWDRAEIDAIHSALGLNYSDEYQLLETYQRLADCMQYVRRGGVHASTLHAWATPTPGQQESTAIKQVVKARYDLSAWPQISATLQDGIREKKRSALVDYLIANAPDRVSNDPSQGKAWSDANSLFAYFLVDVEMSACQLTSRVKQAIGAVQLFVQRCFLNLEQPAVVIDTTPDDGDDTFYDEDWLQWEWMQNYRVWEANRKVFLYPENWIEPELRKDKSPFFQELEDELQQNEITADSAERAFLNYLEKLDQVARLEVCGMCKQYEPDGATLTHVVARTRGIPHSYYYRVLQDNAWSSWQKIDVEIQSDHVLPVIYNRKLHLFWIIFTPRPEETQELPAAEASSDPPPAPKSYLELQLAWSIYRNGKWTPKKISREKLLHPQVRPGYSYSFNASLDDENNLTIRAFLGTSREFNDARIPDIHGLPTARFRFPSLPRHSETQPPRHVSSFVFAGEVTHVLLTNDDDWYETIHSGYGEDGLAIEPLANQVAPRLLPTGLHYSYNQLVNNIETFNNNLNTIVLDSRLRDGELMLSDTPTPFAVVTDSGAPYFPSQETFFYQDKMRTYLVIPTIQSNTEYPASKAKVFVPDSTHYIFYEFYHPYTRTFIRELDRLGIPGLLNRQIQVSPQAIAPVNTFDFNAVYHPHPPFVSAKSKTEQVDFDFGGAYAEYNWELFFHAPLLIAERLSQNQQFEEALTWFNYIFNPTNPSKEAVPKKYWITKPFYNQNSEDYRNQQIDQLLRDVNANMAAYVQQVAAWRADPFDPHMLARLRYVAYQWTVVMKYIDNLIAWGDALFASDTIESINEATQLYILAAEILGPRPLLIPEHTPSVAKAYNDLEPDLDTFGNTLQELENQVTLSGSPGGSAPGDTPTPKLPTFYPFYYSIPPNDKVLGYWDTVADRLYKIRHCMNIEGMIQQLPLFEPPIDPALLVKAAAASSDLSSVLSDLSVPLPNYRFNVVIQRAYDLCNQVREFGRSLLTALEQHDAETLALMRASHERLILAKISDARNQQITEAGEAKEAVSKTLELARTRQAHYQTLLTNGLNAGEKTANNLSLLSAGFDAAIASGYVLAGGLKLIPSFTVGAAGFGGSPTATTETGGKDYGGSADNAVKTMISLARALEHGSAIASTMAVYDRRKEEWQFQKDLADKDVDVATQQMDVAQARYDLALKELDVATQQSQCAAEIDAFMHSKYTNQELYDWMITQLSAVYFQVYNLAYQMAKRAEKAYQYETGQFDARLITFGYWDSLKKGLLAGEQLDQDLHRLETAYLDQHTREYEITKHISLAQLDPASLLRLIETGTCQISLPELLFDMDYPGHYMRRIKAVSLSIPCIAGPYTGVNCTLTLLSNSLRLSNQVGSSYARTTSSAGDERFRDNVAAVQSIATSHARNDAGTFELNFRDERYLPFEGAGLTSSWRIDLPRENNFFDFNTISDVILHISYTAREGGSLLKAAAQASVAAQLPTLGRQLLDLKRDFASAWQRFQHPNPVEGDQVLTLALDNSFFPFYVRNKTIQVKAIQVLADMPNNDDYDLVLTPPLPDAAPLALTRDGQYGNLHHAQQTAPSGTSYALSPWQIKIKRASATDFRSLTDDEIQHCYMILDFNTAP